MQPIAHTLMRPDDGDAFKQALRLAQQRVDLPIVFGGPVHDGVLNLTQFVGVRTAGLRGLTVLAATGLGGQVLVERRPRVLNNYESAHSITHDYDEPVLAEGIRSVTAVPVVTSGAVRGVLYGATRGPVPLGDRATDVMVGVSRHLAGELTVRDEVDRRLRLRRAAEANAARIVGGDAVEEVRELLAELRVIAQTVQDDALRERLLHASDRLAGLGTEPDAEAGSAPSSPLSPREIDVLAQVALGCSNAEAASRLSLQPETVKAYLRSAMRKFGARTRFEAVVAARRRGLLP